MYEYYPLLIVGGIIGLMSAIFIAAYFSIKDKKEAIGFDRNMRDGEIIKRLAKYARPHLKSFILVLVIMLLSISYDIISPTIVGDIEEMIKDEFVFSELLVYVAVYAGILAVSLVCTYIQAMILQKTGQKILSALREDLFIHIESLSHNQLHEMPVGKLVTRVTNDTNAISMLFTNILVNLVKNIFVIFGVVGAMLMLNYGFTLMVLCFAPFIALFTVIFRKFSRKAYREVKDGTTDINTFLSENLSGMKIIQIFNREDRKMSEFEQKNQKLKSAKYRQIFVFGIFRPMVYMLYITSVLCLLYLGARGYIKSTVFMGQTVTSGVVVSFYMYITKFFNPIQSLAEQFNWLQSAFASAEKIFSVLDIVPEIVDSPDATDLSDV
ncbi:MAG: ABC transporter ATP-binding protein, partial [Clostridia bacterium]|nr:ABC transporter ATP-binding protein [Clostridia bacterium]